METRQLTYAELAKALGINTASAKRLAIRKGWQKTIGNDGKARVAVPVERLDQSEGDSPKGNDTGDVAGVVMGPVAGDDPGAVTSDVPPPLNGSRQLLAYLESRVSELTGELKEARETIATLNETAKRVEGLQAEAKGLEALLEAERKRSDELRAETAKWQAQAEETLAKLPAPQPERRGFMRRLFG